MGIKILTLQHDTLFSMRVVHAHRDHFTLGAGTGECIARIKERIDGPTNCSTVRCIRDATRN